MLLALSSACARGAESRAESRLGYSATAFRRQQALEQRFRDGVSAERLSAFHRAITRRPHPAGSDGAREVADSLRRLLAEAGLDVEVLEYRVWLSRPREIAVRIVAPVSETLRVREPASSLDRDTSHPELGPGYVAYSASGDVTAPVVYVNYGLPADYAQLAARGVVVKGKLALARYGRATAP